MFFRFSNSINVALLPERMAQTSGVHPSSSTGFGSTSCRSSRTLTTCSLPAFAAMDNGVLPPRTLKLAATPRPIMALTRLGRLSFDATCKRLQSTSTNSVSPASNFRNNNLIHVCINLTQDIPSIESRHAWGETRFSASSRCRYQY